MTKKTETIKLEVDYCGKECYEINFGLRLKIKDIAIGEILKMTTDNPAAQEKIFRWCEQNKQEMFLSNFEDGLFVYYIKRKS